MSTDGLANTASEETKTRLLEAATQIFCELGYHNATMAKIAEVAGVAKGTVYWYFSGKEDLFLGMIVRALEELVTKLERVVAQTGVDFPEIFRRVTVEYLEFFYQQSHLSKVIINGAQGLSTDFHKQMMYWHNRINLINVKMIRMGIEAGLFRSDLDIELVGSAYAGLVSAIGNETLFTNREPGIEEETQLITTIFLEGISRRG